MKEIVIALIVLASIFMIGRVCRGRARNVPADAIGFTYLLQTVATRAQTDRLPGHLHLSSVISFAILALALLCWPPVDRRRAGRQFETLAVCVFWILQLLLTNAVGSGGLRSLFEVVVVAVPVAMLARHVDRLGAIRLMSWLVWVAIIQCAFAVLEIVRGKPVWGYAKNASGTADFVQSNNIVPVGVPRLEGATGHSIMFGAVMVLGCVGLMFMSTARTRTRVALACPLLAFLLLSGSRGALLTLLLLVLYWMVSPQVRISFGARIVGWTAFLGVAYAAYSLVASIIADWQQTGSYLNRSKALDSFKSLLSMNIQNVIFGHGWSSIPDLFDAGVLKQTNEFQVVDNQFVTTFATGGLLSLAILLVIAIAGWRTKNVINRSLMIVVFLGCAFFDSLTWGPMIVIFSAFASVGAVMSPALQGRDLPTHAVGRTPIIREVTAP